MSVVCRARRLRRARTAPRVRALALLVVVLGFGALMLAGQLSPARAAEGDPVSSFTLAVLPDTQFYSRYAAPSGGEQFQTRYGSEPFSSQTQWLVQHADELEIPFVAHLGDVVDRVDQPGEWAVADTAMKKLEDGRLPYSILAGNHDVRNQGQFDTEADLANEPYLQHFPPSRAAQQATFGGRDATGFNEWHTFTAEGRTFLVLALHWKASQATLNWAKEVIAQHPTLPVILTTHQLLNIAEDGESPRETEYGQYLWDNLIEDTDQIFVTLNGHYHGASRLTKTNAFGNRVEQIVIDYQMAYLGGNGYLGLYEFDFTNNRIQAETVSPWVTMKPTSTLTQFDRAVLTGTHQQYTIDIDFAERFERFNQSFGQNGPAPSHTSLAEKAKDIILADYTEPGSAVGEPPIGPEDYAKVDGTLVHWRSGDRPEGTVVRPGETVADVSGNGNTLTRAPLNEPGVTGAQEGDVTLTTSRHPLSADPTAVCFANADRTTGRLSYLRTAPEAPLNDETFPNGYTVETFIKLDPSWSAAQNMWSSALARAGQRRNVPGVPTRGVELGATPFNMTISNLREIQWSVLGRSYGAGETTNWSHEIPLGTWLHVATVYDPQTRMTTLYVEGAPVLRNVTNGDGMAAIRDMPWILGAGQYDGRPNGGFNGCVGETRMADRPLSPSQWLTARVQDYRFGGVKAPIRADGSTMRRAGSTVPVKIEVAERDGTPAREGDHRLFVAPVVDGTPGDYRPATPAGRSSRENRFRPAGDGTWLLNWSTRGLAPGVWSLKVILDDGQEHLARIILR